MKHDPEAPLDDDEDIDLFGDPDDVDHSIEDDIDERLLDEIDDEDDV